MKDILDACCGGKMFYFDKEDPRVLFQDIREVDTTLVDGRKFVVRPDVVADFTSMPYDDCSFSGVVFDPPHLKYSGSEKESKGWQMTKYGSLPEKDVCRGSVVSRWQMTKYGSLGADWKETLSRGFAECFRVLKPGGFLIFKWNETDIRLSEILKLTSQSPILGHKSGKRSNTHWVLFMK